MVFVPTQGTRVINCFREKRLWVWDLLLSANHNPKHWEIRVGKCTFFFCKIKGGPPQLSRYSEPPRVGRSGDRIPVRVRFSTPERPWGPHILLYNEYWVSPGGKAAGAWRWALTPSTAEVEERVELCLYSPSGPSWPVLGWTLPLPFCTIKNSEKFTVTIGQWQRVQSSAVTWLLKSDEWHS
jgi:hypothetical protein